MLRCEQCNKDIIHDTKYVDWLALASFFELKYLEEEITETTYHAMMSKLMTFKMFACDDDEDYRYAEISSCERLLQQCQNTIRNTQDIINKISQLKEGHALKEPECDSKDNGDE